MADEETVPFQQLGPEGSRVSGPEGVDVSAGLTFFCNRLCPFAHRAWWAMHEKRVASEFKYIHIDLGEDKPAWYAPSFNPAGTVPAIYDAGKPVFESALCVEYLEDKFPGRGTALLPSGAAERAAVRLFVSQLDFAPFYKFLMTPDTAAHGELRSACEAALVKMEARFGAASASGPYFLGDALSAADIAVLPFLQRFAAGLGHYRAWALEAELGTLAPRLAAALKAARERPAWQATTMAPAFYVAAYSGYAAGKQTVLRAMPRSMLKAW